MSTRRIIVLAVQAAVMLVVAILTWGSVGSLTLVFCLILMGLSLLHQHFLTNRDDDYFQTE